MNSPAEELSKQISDLGVHYWSGKENAFIRYWVYMQRGLAVFNEFKYYIALPYATYLTFSFMKGHFIWIPIMIIGGLPILIIIGRYQLHKINKTTQYVTAITGDIFQFKPMLMSIEQVELLKSIDAKLGILTTQSSDVPPTSEANA